MNLYRLKHGFLRFRLLCYRSNPMVLVLMGLFALCLCTFWWIYQTGRNLQEVQDELAWQVQYQQKRQAKDFNAQSAPIKSGGVDGLREILGDHRHVARNLQKVHDLAVAAGLTLTQGEYRHNCEAEIAVCKFQMQFSVVTSYDRLRFWLHTVLQALPYLAIDTLNLNREDVSEDEIFATVGFTLYLNQEKSATRVSNTVKDGS